MNEDIKIFVKGMVTGVISILVVMLIFSIFSWNRENSGYENKLVIKYHNPHKAYDRQMITDLVEKSQIRMEFVNGEVILDKWGVEYIMTNPLNPNGKNN